MVEELRKTPEELRFVGDVLVEIARNNHEDSLELFMHGLEKLIISQTDITSEQFEFHVAGPLAALIRYKLKENGPRQEGIHSSHESPKQLNCSFCNKLESEFAQLIAGPGIFICEGCVGICNTILMNPPGDHRDMFGSK